MGLKFDRKQCDQMWRNFAMLAQFKKSRQIFVNLFCIWLNVNITLAKMLYYWASFVVVYSLIL